MTLREIASDLMPYALCAGLAAASPRIVAAGMPDALWVYGGGVAMGLAFGIGGTEALHRRRSPSPRPSTTSNDKET